MRAEMAIDRMRGFHRQIRDLLAESLSAIELAERNTVTLAALRWRLVRLLREYQLFKHTEIFDPIIRGDRASRSADAGRLKAACEETGAAYNDHIRRWNLSGTGETSPDYAADARHMIRRVGEHLDREQLDIRRLLDGVERTRDG